ncbi:gluconolactonase [Mycobacterium mantenii]|uniref:Gluconolactonase n=1 Tax=Mycobacterium mantenii TaxID=560555 RepID=A0A1X0FM04_MYCNT|nr:SMP-30/gluconolactonase/LRE family protein [Mycobacterium mantenii]MCV7246509.1 SMP-30/gluconolactonase/LRE family protein [Mycobacterium mantenii]ORB02852.1 gluconolactonase [Mycobacterium mantenii]BBY38021.1 gluconolactonase [Mycobacterium mantenii]
MIGALDGQLKHSLTPLADGFCLGKSPSWFEGLLWFSDELNQAVHTVNLLGAMTTLPLPGHAPCGLGFRPDGSLLIASADDRRILRYDGETVVPIADLSGVVSGDLGDMVVDDLGHAYVGCEAARGCGVIVRVDPDDSTTVVADVPGSPAGMVMTPDGRTLIVAEPSSRRLSAFEIDSDGALADRRTFADGLDGSPDGITFDSDGGVWAAIASARQFQRIVAGGLVTDRIDMRDRTPTACTLGGPGCRILFLMSGEEDRPGQRIGRRRGHLDAVTADIPGVALP